MKQNDESATRGAIEWLEFLLCIVCAVALTIVYLLLPIQNQTRWMTLLDDLIPNCIAALLVFPIVYLVLNRAGIGSEQRLAREIQNVLGGSGAVEVFKEDVGSMAPAVAEIVAERAVRGEVRIQILAFTGGTFTTALLRDLIMRWPNRLSLELHAIDFARVEPALVPSHWPKEEIENESRLSSLCTGTAKLKMFRYPSLPAMLGLQIDDTDLFIAFTRWDAASTRLADTSLEYRHYRRSPQSEYLFSLFENWLHQPRQVDVPLPAAAPAVAAMTQV